MTKKSLLAAIYFFVVVLTIVSLSVELYLAYDYSRRLKGAREIAEGNVFISQRKIITGASDSLWDIPYQSYRPDSSVEVTLENGETYRVEINEHGFRTKSFSIYKSKDAIRVVAIGGSTTIQGLTNDMTYPAYMERLLKAEFPDKNIQVLNLGISGTKSEFWLERFDELLSYQPDIVVQYNGINDFAWNHIVHYAEKKPEIKIYNKSYLYQRLGLLDETTFDKHIVTTLDNFSRLKKRLEQRGIEYITSSFAMPRYDRVDQRFKHFLDKDAAGWGIGLGLKYYSNLYRLMQRHNALFKRYFVGKNVKHVLLDAHIYDQEFFIDSAHMSDRGIRLMAALFTRKVAVIIANN